MSTQSVKTLLAFAVLAIGGTTTAHARWGTSGQCYVRPATPAPAAYTPPASGVIYKVVQQTPQYDVGRPQVVSGTRVTLFANFLRQDPGCVLFNLNGTSAECAVIEWKPNSVTVELPRLGLLEPKNAEIQIVLPDGRIAKTFPVVYIAQPDILVHEDTIPQPMPPAPKAQAAVYAMPVQGGLVLQAVSE